MNSKHTLIWFVIAVALFMFVFIYEYFQRLTVPESLEILPGLRQLAVTSIQVYPKNAPEISVERTNDTWFLTQPVAYPAQKTAVDDLLDAVQKLKAAMRISPAEMGRPTMPMLNTALIRPRFPWSSNPATTVAKFWSAIKPLPATRYSCASSARKAYS